MIEKRPNTVFWLCFLLLHALIFLPSYLLNLDSSSFLPTLHLSDLDPVTTLKRLVRRENQDIFRLSLELCLLMGLFVFTGLHKQRWFRVFCYVFYVFVLLYAVYESSMRKLYLSDPVLYSDLALIEGGGVIVARELIESGGWKYGLHLLGLVGAGVLVGILLVTFFRRIPVERLHPVTRWVTAGLIGFVLLNAAYFRDRMDVPDKAVSSIAVKLRENLTASVQLRRAVASYDAETVEQSYRYHHLHLQERPNIYLIWIESYGGILYSRAELAERYRALLSELQGELSRTGLHAASTMSRSPISGGASWLAYTSSLFGLRVGNQGMYHFLMDRYQSAEYPDLGAYLKSQGYRSYRLSALPLTNTDSTAWVRPQNLYNLDQWIRYDDLEFTGHGYGWGPSPPDQYSLNKAYELIQAQTPSPYLLFYITQNSHYPWTYVPDLVPDWTTLNNPATAEPQTSVLLHKADPDTYFNVIDYQLRFLTDFILKVGDDGTLFVLFGDHQPPLITTETDGMGTPLHIISRDSALVEGFSDYGFDEGLLIHDTEARFRHEGFLSMMVRELVRRYGTPGQQLPPYLPEGIIMTTQPGR